jgi:FHS family L-fucose permease-like MFS transporter
MATITTPAAQRNLSPAGAAPAYRGPFAIMTVLFFMWGFMTVFNDILIPRFKEAFTLDFFHAMLVQLAFFGAYFVGSLLYFIISALTGDPIARIGYKNGVIIGLLISAFGSAIFWPAATLAPRSSEISAGDLSKIELLATRLSEQKDPVSIFVYENTSESTRQSLKQGGQDAQQALAQDLDKLIKGPAIHDEQRFAGVKLEPTTRELLELNQKEAAKLNKTADEERTAAATVLHLNRALLEDTYPGEVNKNLLPYWVFLVALFIVGMGFAMLQIAANPYVTILGPERTASSRLNLAQSFNSLGTTIGPLIGGWLIFQYFAKTGAHGAESAKIPYLIFCIIFVIMAVVFFCIHLPHVGEGKAEQGIGALKYPHVVLGVLAILMYVGGEVSVGSAIINFLGQPDVAGMSAVDASKYVALFWGGMLIGRFMGAVELSEMAKAKKQALLVAIPILGFLLFFVLRSWNSATDLQPGHFDFSAGWKIVENYLPMLAFCWVLFQFGKAMPGRTLFIFSATIVVLLVVAVLMGGKLAMWCVVGIGLFTSIGWPNIFSLALDKMGVLKGQVSSLLVMAVVGGALLPPLQGKIADILIKGGNQHGLQFSFVVPMIAYAYVAFYGLIGHKIGRTNLEVAA